MASLCSRERSFALWIMGMLTDLEQNLPRFILGIPAAIVTDRIVERRCALLPSGAEEKP
jgi:hypothetical protein